MDSSSRDKKKKVVVVVPLTHELCNSLKAAAAAALHGDGSCSLKAMSMSCFASEICAKSRYSSMTLDLLMHHPYRFVALDEETGDFVGCVSATIGTYDGTVQRYFPKHSPLPRELVLYNLCVAHSHRGCGAGKMLVERVVESASRPEMVYLLVSKLKTDDMSNVERMDLYKKRVSKLLQLYDHLDFDVIDQCEDCYFLKHR